MSNKLKKTYKNKEVRVNGVWTSPSGVMTAPIKIDCLVTNDEVGKTLSIITPHDGMFTIAFEQLERYLK